MEHVVSTSGDGIADTRPRFVYTLHDPTDVSARVYVGITINPRRRLNKHVSTAGYQTIKSKWLKSLLDRGVTPEMVILEEVPAGADHDEAEQFWIASLRSLGLSLTNATDGGDGTRGYRPKSDPAKERRRARRTWKRAELALQHAVVEYLERRPHAGQREVAPRNRENRSIDKSLRFSTQKARGSSGFKGVSIHGDRFRAQLVDRGCKEHLGIFETAVEAAVAYDEAARRRWGSRTAVNFPRAGELCARSVPTLDVPTELPSVEVRRPGAHLCTNTTGYTGVIPMRGANPGAAQFVAHIAVGRRAIHLGSFHTAEEAAGAYQRAVLLKRRLMMRKPAPVQLPLPWGALDNASASAPMESAR